MEVELIPDEKTWEQMAKFFETSVEELKVAVKRSGVINNLHGNLTGSSYSFGTSSLFYDPNTDTFTDASTNAVIYILDRNQNKFIISGFPMHLKQHELIRKQLQAFNLWATLPRDVFYQLIETNDIRGKDLISLCVANPKINDLCNKQNGELFRRLLLRDRVIKPNEDPKRPWREYYVEQNNRKLKVSGHDLTVVAAGAGDHTEVSRIGVFVDVQHVAAGGNHYAFVKDNTVYTAGKSANKWLGRSGDPHIPQPINMKAQATQVACGSVHTVILDTRGNVWVCGSPYSIEAQFGASIGHKTPDTGVPLMLRNLPQIKTIACGSDTTGMIDKSGRVYTCGLNSHGQLGHGDFESRKMPTLIEGFEGVKQISMGYDHSALIDEENNLWTFGENEDGRLGHDQEMDGEPWLVPNLPKVKQVSCGHHHTMCITLDGQLWAFGYNRYGQLGLSNNKSPRIPTRVMNLPKISQVACGSYGTYIITESSVLMYTGLVKVVDQNTFECYATFQELDTSVKEVAAGNGFALFIQ